MSSDLESTLGTYSETLEFLKINYKLSNDEVFSMTNRFYPMSHNLSRGLEQMGAVGTFIAVLAMAKPCSGDAGTLVLIPLAQNLATMVKTIPSMSPVVAPQLIQLAGQQVGHTVAKESVKVAAKIGEEVLESCAKTAAKVGSEELIESFITSVKYCKVC